MNLLHDTILNLGNGMWKKIKNYPDYEINELGTVRRGAKILKHNVSTNGYIAICLCKNGKPKLFRLHRLLAENFISNPLKKPQVNHIDGNRKNNNLDNLEWVTISENMLHAIHVTKTKPAPCSMLGKFGKDHNLSKHFYLEYPDGKIIKYESGLDLVRKTGFDHSAISWARVKKQSGHKFSRGKMKGIIVHFELVT
jgi:hypothetical protein